MNIDWSRVFKFCYLRNKMLLFWGLNTTWVQYIYSAELCKLYKYRSVTKGLCSKRYINCKQVVDFHSFLLEFIKHRYTVWSIILWFVHWPLNTFIGYSINSLSSLVNQSLKRTVEDPGFEKSLVKHKCPSSNKIPNGYFSRELARSLALVSIKRFH